MWIIIFGIVVLVIIGSISDNSEKQLAATRELWRLADPEAYALDEKRQRRQAIVRYVLLLVIGLVLSWFFIWCMTRTN